MWRHGAFPRSLVILSLAVVLFASGSRAEVPNNENQLVSQRDTNGDVISDQTMGKGEPLMLFLCGFGVLLIATAYKRKFWKEIPSDSQSTELPAMDSQAVHTEPLILGRGGQWGTGDREA